MVKYAQFVEWFASSTLATQIGVSTIQQSYFAFGSNLVTIYAILFVLHLRVEQQLNIVLAEVYQFLSSLASWTFNYGIAIVFVSQPQLVTILSFCNPCKSNHQNK